MRVGLLFGMTGGGLRGCDVADAILFPPRGIQAGNHPKYIIFFNDDVEFQRLATVANGCQLLAKCSNGCQRLPAVAKVW